MRRNAAEWRARAATAETAITASVSAVAIAAVANFHLRPPPSPRAPPLAARRPRVRYPFSPTLTFPPAVPPCAQIRYVQLAAVTSAFLEYAVASGRC